jgi:hypothetical protein
MRQPTTCNHNPCHSYCPRLGVQAAREGRLDSTRESVAATASTTRAAS